MYVDKYKLNIKNALNEAKGHGDQKCVMLHVFILTYFLGQLIVGLILIVQN